MMHWKACFLECDAVANCIGPINQGSPISVLEGRNPTQLGDFSAQTLLFSCLPGLVGVALQDWNSGTLLYGISHASSLSIPCYTALLPASHVTSAVCPSMGRGSGRACVLLEGGLELAGGERDFCKGVIPAKSHLTFILLSYIETSFQMQVFY